METRTLTIDSNFCFRPRRKRTIALSYVSLKNYTSRFESEAFNLEGDLPIILDTNVLLGYYGMAEEQKRKLVKFFNKYKDRIYITEQIEKEFLKNRISVIHKDFLEPLKQITKKHTSMISDVKGSLQSFREHTKKILSNSYPSIWSKLMDAEKAIIDALENTEIKTNLEIQIETATKDNSFIEITDKLLEVCSQFKVLPSLEKDEIDFIAILHKELLEEYQKSGKKVAYTFPSCGEEKDDNKDGDFIILHEILKFMKLQNTSCVFFTKDISKGDWLQKNNYQPFAHYIEETYYLTEQTMFILNAENFLSNINFENVHVEEDESKNQSEEETLPILHNNIPQNEWMRMVLASQSIQANMQFNVYYHDSFRGYSPHSYIGLYANKSIRGIGKVENIIYASLDNQKLLIHSCSKEVTDDQKKRILNAIAEASTRGWDISQDCVYFCVEKFYETDFEKTSLYAPMGTRFFNLKEELNLSDLPDTNVIADNLKDKKWE